MNHHCILNYLIRATNFTKLELNNHELILLLCLQCQDLVSNCKQGRSELKKVQLQHQQVQRNSWKTSFAWSNSRANLSCELGSSDHVREGYVERLQCMICQGKKTQKPVLHYVTWHSERLNQLLQQVILYLEGQCNSYMQRSQHNTYDCSLYSQTSFHVHEIICCSPVQELKTQQ